MIDRPPILIKAPKAGVSRAEWDALQSPDDIPPDEVMDWFTNVDRVVERCNRLVASICWGGEALPVTFPVATRIIAITAAYVGCPYTIDPVSRTGWPNPLSMTGTNADPPPLTPTTAGGSVPATCLMPRHARPPTATMSACPTLTHPARWSL